jgi:hypothetical protein
MTPPPPGPVVKPICTSSFAESFLPLIRQKQSVLNPAAALQHPVVFRASISLANNFGASQLEFCRKIRHTSPLDVLVIVVRSLVRTPHGVYGVKVTGIATGAS